MAFNCFSCLLSYINVPGDRQPRGKFLIYAFTFFVVEAEDGAAWASCQNLQCHMRVINQNYYEVCVMVRYERLWRVVGGDGFDSACLLSSRRCWCGCWWPGGQTDCPSNTGPGNKPAVSAHSQPAEVVLDGKVNLEKHFLTITGDVLWIFEGLSPIPLFSK